MQVRPRFAAGEEGWMERFLGSSLSSVVAWSCIVRRSISLLSGGGLLLVVLSLVEKSAACFWAMLEAIATWEIASSRYWILVSSVVVCAVVVVVVELLCRVVMAVWKSVSSCPLLLAFHSDIGDLCARVDRRLRHSLSPPMHCVICGRERQRQRARD